MKVCIGVDVGGSRGTNTDSAALYARKVVAKSLKKQLHLRLPLALEMPFALYLSNCPEILRTEMFAFVMSILEQNKASTF
jgi:hypothetical protein